MKRFTLFILASLMSFLLQAQEQLNSVKLELDKSAGLQAQAALNPESGEQAIFFKDPDKLLQVLSLDASYQLAAQLQSELPDSKEFDRLLGAHAIAEGYVALMVNVDRIGFGSANKYGLVHYDPTTKAISSGTFRLKTDEFFITSFSHQGQLYVLSELAEGEKSALMAHQVSPKGEVTKSQEIRLSASLREKLEAYTEGSLLFDVMRGKQVSWYQMEKFTEDQMYSVHHDETGAALRCFYDQGSLYITSDRDRDKPVVAKVDLETFDIKDVTPDLEKYKHPEFSNYMYSNFFVKDGLCFWHQFYYDGQTLNVIDLESQETVKSLEFEFGSASNMSELEQKPHIWDRKDFHELGSKKHARRWRSFQFGSKTGLIKRTHLLVNDYPGKNYEVVVAANTARTQSTQDDDIKYYDYSPYGQLVLSWVFDKETMDYKANVGTPPLLQFYEHMDENDRAYGWKEFAVQLGVNENGYLTVGIYDMRNEQFRIMQFSGDYVEMMEAKTE